MMFAFLLMQNKVFRAWQEGRGNYFKTNFFSKIFNPAFPPLAGLARGLSVHFTHSASQ
jgi:hypothetical protein